MEIGTKIRFKTISDFTGEELTLEGTIEGGPKEIKKLQPEEYGGMKDSEKVHLVKRVDSFGNTLRYVVYPDEILEIL
jgi:hypothetical protein